MAKQIIDLKNHTSQSSYNPAAEMKANMPKTFASIAKNHAQILARLNALESRIEQLNKRFSMLESEGDGSGGASSREEHNRMVKLIASQLGVAYTAQENIIAELNKALKEIPETARLK